MHLRKGGRAASVSICQHTSAYASVCSTMCVRTGGRAVTSESPHCFLRVFRGPYLCAAAASWSRWPASKCSCCTPNCSCCSSRYTSAYVSIRQHTSAYVSIRQHTLLHSSPPLGVPVWPLIAAVAPLGVPVWTSLARLTHTLGRMRKHTRHTMRGVLRIHKPPPRLRLVRALREIAGMLTCADVC
jgi:hypothetical protein